MLKHATRSDVWITHAKGKGGRPPDLEKREKVRRLFREGFSDAEIAAELGNTPGAVRNMRRKLGLWCKTRDRSRTYADKTCPVCGRTFPPFSGRQVYCGPACRRVNRVGVASGQTEEASQVALAAAARHEGQAECQEGTREAGVPRAV